MHKFNIKMLNIRGGVEDTKLEAKAKDTKKSDVKAKNSPSKDRLSQGQGTKTQTRVFKKKKSSKKTFSADLPTIFKDLSLRGKGL